MRFVCGVAFILLSAASCATASTATGTAATASNEDPGKVAEAYLNALVGGSDEAGLDLLLGGATTNAKLFALENWRIVGPQAPRHEEADVGDAARLMEELDQASRVAMSSLMQESSGGESVSVEKLPPEVAAQLLGPTQAISDRLTTHFPLMAHVLRVGQATYWSPRNPMRPLMAKAGSGPYVLDLRRFEIETTEGPRKVPRRWHLGVLRFKTQALDTGWKVLPAADWNAE